MRAGQLIRELREATGVSTKKLCAAIGMTLGQLSDIERGIQTVSLRRAHQIAEVLGVPFDEVVAEILREKLHEAGFREIDLKVAVVTRFNGNHVGDSSVAEEAESSDRSEV